MSAKLTVDQQEFMESMLFENPFADHRWENFDPPFLRKVVRPLEERKLIETRGSGRDAEHRFTKLGQSEVLRGILESRGYKVMRPHGLVVEEN